MKLAEKQQKWQRLANRLTTQTRRSEKNQCRDKFRHEDFFSAMSHARDLTSTSGKLYTPYVCVHCGFQHVGHVGESVVWMFEGVSFRADARS
jgi:hypothetical protein